ncbi:MAG: PAS domain S-box protein [Acidobacteriota bacterium]
MESSIFENLPVGLYRTTADGRILNANLSFARILGFPTVQACMATNILEAYADPADRERWRAELERAGMIENAELRLRRRDGAIIWAKDTCRLALTPSGQARYEGVLEDITARRRALEQLQESEARFRAVFEHSPVAKCLVRPDGRFLAVSPAMCAMLGYEADELLSRHFADVTHPDDVEASRAWVQALLSGQAATSRLEKRYLHRSGRTLWGAVSTSLLWHADGTPNLFVTEIYDTTAQKHAEEALQQSEERYRSLVASLGDGVVLQDAAAGIVAANVAAERLLGLSPEQLMGRTWSDPALPMIDQDGHPVAGGTHPALVTLRTGQPQVDVILGIPRPTGEPTWVSLNAQPLIRPGATAPYAVVTTLRDITTHRRLAAQFEQAQKMEAIGQLAGGVAHDFNNVLTAILGYSDLLLESLAGDPRAGDVREIRSAGEAARRLTQQLLAFSRRQTLQLRALNLNEVVGTTSRLLARLVGDDVQVMQQLDPDLRTVRADASQIQQVLMNLAVNARDAMPAGGFLTIETANVMLDEAYAAMRPQVTPGAYVMMAVTDTGHGMTPEVQQHLFEPFFTTKERGVGTGLGLATVYGVVKQSGGYIWVYSEVDRGTTFKMYFPVVSDRPGVLPLPVGPTESRGGSETILVVEDNSQLLNLARRALHELGYDVLVASDGSEALRLGESHPGPIHLLFTDVVMPGLSGPDIFKALASQHPGVKAVYTSGYTHGMTVHHLGIGTAPFLRKPYTPASLAQAIRATLDAPAAAAGEDVAT